MSTKERDIKVAAGAVLGDVGAADRADAADVAIDGSERGIGAASAEPKRRRVSRKTAIITAVQVAIVAGGFCAWQFLSGNPRDGGLVVFDEFYFGKPSRAWDALVAWAESGVLLDASTLTLRDTAIGFTIGCSAGVIVGFVLGISTTIARTFRPFLIAANTVPKVALAPLFLLWFGLGSGSTIVLAALLVFFLVYNTTFSGVRDVDGDLVNALRMMGASRLTIYRRVVIPSALVWVIAGFRVSVPYAFLGVVVGQMLSSNKGLGSLIHRASTAFNPSAMFGGIFILVLMSLTVSLAIGLIERRLLRWKYVK